LGDVKRFRDQGTQVVVSLLCYSERAELGLDEEAAAGAWHGIERCRDPMVALTLPS
jgi:hypothetical protein